MKIRFILASVACLAVCLVASHLRAQTGPEPPTPDQDPTGHTGALKANVSTGGGYNAHNGNGIRTVTDLYVPSALGDYGLDFTRYWNSLPPGDEPRMPAAMPFNDFGASGWTHSWNWNATYEEILPKIIRGNDGNTETDGVYQTCITITFPDGRVIKYTIRRYWPGGQYYVGDPRHGPPYSAQEANWPAPGQVRDYLEQMAPDGSEFWFHRSDGGSVHFVGASWVDYQGHKWWSYEAREVYDPHGYKTELEYTDGFLTKVKQENGGRWLTINWGYSIAGSMAAVISSVQTGGFAATQTVNYTYAVTGNALTLRTAEYEVPSAQYPNGLKASYIYQNSLLMEADDPHVAGAMTRIRYKYRMERCLDYPVSDPPDAHFYYIYAQGEALTEEQSPHNDQYNNPIAVSRFAIHCWDGTRTEWNGFGAWRNFYYGHSATWPGSGSHGHELAQITDFTWDNVTVHSVRQSHLNGNPHQLWDGRDIMTQLTYGDNSGLPKEVHHVDADGSFRSYNRSDPGNSAPRDPDRIHNPHNRWLFSQTDERGLTTTYRRDGRRRVTDIIYHDNSTEHFTYNELNQIVTHTLASGAVKTFEYDPTTHRLMREYNSADEWDARREYTYDEFDRVKTMKDGRARINGKEFAVKLTYNYRHQVLSEEYPATDGGANPTKEYRYDQNGNCIGIKNELGAWSTYTYDDYRRCTSYTEPLNAPAWNGSGTELSRRWDWFYDRWIDNVGQRGASSHTKNEWRIQVGPAFNAAGERRMTARAHDLQNRIVVEQTGWVQSGNLPLGNWWHSEDFESRSFTYDENGQKKTFTDPLQRVTTYQYDLRNRLWQTIEPLGRVTETLYDTTGNKTDVIFPDTESQHWRDYDPFGQAWTFIDEHNKMTNLTYCWGPMKKLYIVTTHREKDGGGTEDQPTFFGYDGMGRPIQVIFPDASDEFSTYEFGQLKTWKTRKHQVQTINYDARGREISHTWSGNAAPGIWRTWDNANRLTSLENVVSKIEYIYDDAGQVREEGNTIAGSGGRVPITYFRYPDGATSIMTYPNGHKVRRDYTARGQLAAVGYPDANGNALLEFIRYNYLADGKVTNQFYYNGAESRFAYDGRGMTQVVHHRRVAPFLQTHSWRYHWRDERDRLTAFQKGTDNSGNPMENGHGDRFRYDEQGQLKEAWYNAADPANSGAGNSRYDGFNYDELGNRMGANFLANHGPMTFTRKDNGLNQYRGWWNFAITNYDDDIAGWGAPGTANGVLMQEGNMTAGFNALNQPMLISSEATSPGWMFFGYDPLGRCVKRWVAPLDNGSVPPADSNPATYFYYEGWNLLSEGQAGLPTERIYVHGNRVDEIVCDFHYPDAQWRYHHYDARGHGILLTGPDGYLVEQYEYDAFGQPYFYNAAGAPTTVNGQAASSFGNRFLFTGREWLSDLKLYDYRNRMYQPELGRFLQPDPKHFEGGDFNLYRYCHNDPVNHSDPMGLTIDYEYADPGDASATRAMIGRLEGMGGDIAATIKQLRDSTNRIVFIPIQRDVAGWDKYNLNPRTKGDDTNKTTPRNEENSRNGKGTGSVIEFDPKNWKDSEGKPRNPIEAAGHEARHAAANDKGNRLNKKDEEKRAQKFQLEIRKKIK